jgi:hypothetical protein
VDGLLDELNAEGLELPDQVDRFLAGPTGVCVHAQLGVGPDAPIQAAMSDGSPGRGSGRHAAASQNAIMDSSETP